MTVDRVGQSFLESSLPLLDGLFSDLIPEFETYLQEVEANLNDISTVSFFPLECYPSI
jgi:hypothetical protein